MPRKVSPGRALITPEIYAPLPPLVPPPPAPQSSNMISSDPLDAGATMLLYEEEARNDVVEQVKHEG